MRGEECKIAGEYIRPAEERTNSTPVTTINNEITSVPMYSALP